MGLSKYRILTVNTVLAATLLGSLWGRRTEALPVPKNDFLRPLSLPFRGWKTSEMSLSEREKEMLRPDATLLRSYESPDKRAAVDFAVIAGHRKQTVHTPAFCLAGGGWETLSTRDYALTVGNRKIESVRSIMLADGREVVVTYFFTDGEFSTRELVRYQAAQMLRRLRAEIPMGALVRIIVPVGTDREAAERLSDEFAGETLPKILDKIRDARKNDSAQGTASMHLINRRMTV